MAVGRRRARLLTETGKRRGIVDGDVGQNLAVQFQSRLLQSADKPAVADAVLLRGGGDADDPQRPVLALLLPPAGKGELQSALDRFFRRPVQL